MSRRLKPKFNPCYKPLNQNIKRNALIVCFNHTSEKIMDGLFESRIEYIKQHPPILTKIKQYPQEQQFDKKQVSLLILNQNLQQDYMKQQKLKQEQIQHNQQQQLQQLQFQLYHQQQQKNQTIEISQEQQQISQFDKNFNDQIQSQEWHQYQYMQNLQNQQLLLNQYRQWLYNFQMELQYNQPTNQQNIPIFQNLKQLIIPQGHKDINMQNMQYKAVIYFQNHDEKEDQIDSDDSLLVKEIQSNIGDRIQGIRKSQNKVKKIKNYKNVPFKLLKEQNKDLNENQIQVKHMNIYPIRRKNQIQEQKTADRECFKVMIMIKGMGQQVLWVSLDQLGINLNKSRKYKIKHLVQQIMKYQLYHIDDYEDLSIAYERIEGSVKFIKQNFYLEALKFDYQTIIKIIRNFRIFDNLRVQMEMIRIVNPGEWYFENATQNDLKAVNDLVVENSYGRVQFLQSVDLRDVNLQEVLVIEQDSIEFYGLGNIPPQGSGLNVGCRITFFRFGRSSNQYRNCQDLENDQQFMRQIQEWSNRNSMQIVQYKNGNLTVKINEL